MLLLACQTLDPGAGSLIGEIWNECVPLDALPVLEGMYEQAIGHEAAMDQDAARRICEASSKQKSLDLRRRPRGTRNGRSGTRCWRNIERRSTIPEKAS